jgi:hypothetical protein
MLLLFLIIAGLILVLTVGLVPILIFGGWALVVVLAVVLVGLLIGKGLQFVGELLGLLVAPIVGLVRLLVWLFEPLDEMAERERAKAREEDQAFRAEFARRDAERRAQLGLPSKNEEWRKEWRQNLIIIGAILSAIIAVVPIALAISYLTPRSSIVRLRSWRRI